jgi:hypothetical protein
MDTYGHGMLLLDAWTWQVAFLDKITSDPDDLHPEQNRQDDNQDQDMDNPNHRDNHDLYNPHQDQPNPDQGVLNPPNLTSRIEMEIKGRFQLELEEFERRLCSIID